MAGSGATRIFVASEGRITLCESALRAKRRKNNFGPYVNMFDPSRQTNLTAQATATQAIDSPGFAEPSPASLLGTWELVTFTSRQADGRVEEPWGSHPAGRIVYNADGQVTALLMHERRNEGDGSRSPPEIQGEFSAYFGTYQVDAAQRIITHQVTASLAAARASIELRRNFDFKNGMLILSFPATRNGVPVINNLIWKRVSPTAS
jgi:Lipocalin-like domain